MRQLKDWNKGDKYRNTAHHQQAVLALRELADRSDFGNVEYNQWFEWGIGETTDPPSEGDDQFTDSRYYLQIKRIGGFSPDDAIALVDDASDPRAEASANMVIATNLAELDPPDNDTHTLPVGTKVIYIATFDVGDPNQKHYIFYAIVGTFRVQIDGFVAAAAGKYTASFLNPPESPLATDDDLTYAQLGQEAGECFVFNGHEANREESAHILHIGRQYHGKIIGVDADDVPIVEIWAGPDADERFEVDVTVTGGGTQGGTDDGTQTTPPEYIYNVDAKNGEPIGLAKSIEWVRYSNGSHAPGTHGVAWYDFAGILHLAQVDESAATRACTVPE